MNTDATLCEVCGQPATVTVADYREKPVVKDGRAWKERQSAGEHHFCENHRRKARCLPPEEPKP